MRFPSLAEDAFAIWHAGVDAVRADRVVSENVAWDGRWLTVGEESFDLRGCERLVIIGAGKATYGMLQGLLRSLESTRHPLPATCGWINIPEGVVDHRPLDGSRWSIAICEARPQGINEPTSKVVAGSRSILQLVQQADASTCVINLLSGGGSALLCLPVDWCTLATKIAITRRLWASGATIQELNAVRRCLSQIKGGGLAHHCCARRMITLIISDVMGDPLETIASGPTVLKPAPDPKVAHDILALHCPEEFPEIMDRLRNSQPNVNRAACEISNIILANNATAVDAAGTKAVELGYRYWMRSATEGDGPAESYGVRFAHQLVASQRAGLVDCLISGGEPTVVLPDPSRCGKGGRNQQVVLAAGNWLCDHPDWNCDFAILSGGTDGEDGPTDAAGAWIDRAWVQRCRTTRIETQKALDRCDAYTLFEQTGNLLRTGPTNTNVCDLRVGVVRGAAIP